MTIKEENEIMVENIKALCRSRGITVKALEKALIYPNGTIGKWAKAAKRPPFDRVKPVADYFGLDVEQLREETESRPLFSAVLRNPKVDEANRIVAEIAMEGIKKPAPLEGDGQDDKDRRLIEWFRSLPVEKQKAILISQDAPEDLV